jgi:hypothetical protein
MPQAHSAAGEGKAGMNCDRLLELLTSYEGPRAFNQYRDVDPELDRAHATNIRLQNLRSYLETFAGAQFILVGEAAGYAGCRFSGIPFTCEAQLVPPRQLSWTSVAELATSSSSAKPWVERSATMVWETLGERMDCLLWNAFPWHPIGSSGPLSNRPPGRDVRDGLDPLEHLLALFPLARPYAVGRVAQRALAAMGTHAPYIRHPSHGGKRGFQNGIAALASEPPGQPAGSGHASL